MRVWVLCSDEGEYDSREVRVMGVFSTMELAQQAARSYLAQYHNCGRQHVAEESLSFGDWRIRLWNESQDWRGNGPATTPYRKDLLDIFTDSCDLDVLQ
jgi:hypothetical protein